MQIGRFLLFVSNYINRRREPVGNLRYRGTKVRGCKAPPIASVGRGDPMTPSLRINIRGYILGGGHRGNLGSPIP